MISLHRYEWSKVGRQSRGRVEAEKPKENFGTRVNRCKCIVN